MASARCECKRPMHVHPHVFQFVTRKPRFPPVDGVLGACRTVFGGDLGGNFVLTKSLSVTRSALHSVTDDLAVRA